MGASEGKKDAEFQKFLDTQQYARKGILLYERIFGTNYVSTGGEVTTRQFCHNLLPSGLAADNRVLDIGCGIGGSAFFMAKHYGVHVYGVDLSSNMVSIANDLRESQPVGVQHRVQFHVADATLMDYPENFYDIVYSRDTILHIKDKKSLFQRFFHALKPGGRIVITDYCKGDKLSYSKEFDAYVESRGYNLLTVEAYGQALESVGFVDVHAQNMSLEFIDILKREVNDFSGKKEAIVEEFSLEDFDYIVKGWKDKVDRVSGGDQAWGYFVAKKPFA